MANLKAALGGADETRDLTALINVTNTVAAANDQAHTGAYSFKFSTGAGALASSAQYPGFLADAGFRISVWVRMDGIPTGSPSSTLVIQTASNGAMFTYGINSAGQHVLSPIGTSVVSATGTAVVAANAWFQLELCGYVTSANTFKVNAYVNGVLDATVSSAAGSNGTLTNTGSDRVRFNISGSTFGANKNLWIDDFASDDGASSSAQPKFGPYRVAPLRPFANGSANNFTTQVGSLGSGYGSGHAPQVNELQASDADGWSIVGSGSAVAEKYTVEGIAAGLVNLTYANILYVGGWARVKSVAAETVKLTVDGVDTSIALAANTTTNIFASSGKSTFPAGTGTDIGVTTDTTVTTVSLFECGVVVVYKNGYGLALNAGAFSLTGIATGLAAQRRIAPAVGSFTFAGIATGFAAQRRIAPAVGAFTLTGIGTGLTAQRRIAPAVGAFTLTGIGTGLSAQRRIAPAVGAFTLTGIAAALRASRQIAPAVGTFALSGLATGLTAQRRLAPSPGAFVLTGQSAGLRAGRGLSAGVGSFVLAGVNVALSAARTIAAAAGSFILTGIAAGLRAGRGVSAAPGAFVTTGVSVSLTAAHRLPAGSGAFVLTGISTTLTWTGKSGTRVGVRWDGAAAVTVCATAGPAIAVRFPSTIP